MQYDFSAIERKWQKKWKEDNTYLVKEDPTKPKCYVLDMFPYPSGSGLHVGHPLGYIASDIYARFKRLKGFNVLHPMGFDAFGLPAEQYAIETGQHPARTTEENIGRYKEQLGKIGFSYDWSREVKTSDPNYYKWTQWIFLKLFNSYYDSETNKAQPIGKHINNLEVANPILASGDSWNEAGSEEKEELLMSARLAYRKKSYVNWCEALGTVLANDEVVNGVSERGGHPVEKKEMMQWFLRITAYTERLLAGLKKVDYPEPLKDMQRNWIGKSQGAIIDFEVKDSDFEIYAFTTRPDTIFGSTFLVLAPEHELVSKITTDEQQADVDAYIAKTSKRSERERMAETKNINGCFTGAYARHPFTNEDLPIWIADYVLAHYGSGAIMAVPAGDERDFAFANHFNIEIKNIFKDIDINEEAHINKSTPLNNSDFLNEKSGEDAFDFAITKLEERGAGKRQINYRMRDAGFSRQRYWGEPFPIIYNEDGSTGEENLPHILPQIDSYDKGPEGKGPLAHLTEWVNTAQGIRETDTMPGYAGSSWYYLRYMDPNNTEEFCSKEKSDYWNQVDLYVGGAEHAVGHLLYSRFWCKVLHDLGFVSYDEPYKKLINQGMIQGNSRIIYRVSGEDKYVSAGLVKEFETEPIHIDVSLCNGLELDIKGLRNWRAQFRNSEFVLENEKYICGQQTEKMSKRLYNVVNPDDIIAEYGADTFRMYEMFLGPIEDSKPWDTKGIEGVHRFLKKLWRLFYNEEALLVLDNEPSQEALKILHQTIKKVEKATESFSLNTAVSQFMICVNELSQQKCNSKSILKQLLILLAPYAPHISEELWASIGNKESIVSAAYPSLNEDYLVEDEITYPIAINGKRKLELKLSAELQSKDAEKIILANAEVQKLIIGKEIRKFIFVHGRMINIVV